MARHSDSEQEEYSDQYNESEQEYSDNDPMSEDDNDEESDEEESQDEQPDREHMEKLKRSLAHVSFEQLAEVQDKMGMKEFSKARAGGVDKTDSTKNVRTVSKAQILEDVKGAVSKLDKGARIRRTKNDMKRASKHSPMEVSSKRAIGRFREVVELNKPKVRDPRFEKLSGHFNQDLFEKSYAFLDDYKKSEQDLLRQQIKKAKNPERREELQQLLLKMTTREASAQEAKRKQQLKRERKKAEAELVKQGKTPYFLKRSEQRKLELMDKYEKLGEKNMDKILAKRRKKNAAKDHRRLPFKRRSE
ncbi:ribosomal rna processing protein 36 homolog [Lichtheimia corymbifera JMRC:FSU:9682]|uniref:rRNA biogenesis protein RRP36 n=1 Tax=Lichtheimia corymbifera JMRC:FSU:9682 TaxID=1263082 RepID=A0A068RFQ6_9FUNG|nr:ribosomal rna processing protein 36 homolog [Lichtheimia corymbifera JMRC:FSU:9682]